MPPLDPDPVFATIIANALNLTDEKGKAACLNLATVINAQIKKATITVAGTATGALGGGPGVPVVGTGTVT